MSRGGRFHVLVATDGTPQARAAVAMAVTFPWPRGAEASGVIARGTLPAGLEAVTKDALDKSLERLADQAGTALSARWPRAQVSVASGSAAEAIVDEARRRRARVIVIGSAGLSALARFLIGSVSRTVARDAPCSVLLVRRRARRIQCLVVGVDGSPNSRRAVEVVARLTPPRSGCVTVIRVVEPVRLPSLNLLPARVRSVLGGEARELQARQLQAAKRDVAAAVSRLRRAGWRASGIVRVGTPVDGLLLGARRARAAVVVVGSLGAGGVKHLLLGSVADGVVAQSPVSVLVAR